jgi:hypothetical protein
MVLLLVSLAAAQERPESGAACIPVVYSDFLVTLTTRMSDQSDRYVAAMDSGYDATEGARRTLSAVIKNTRAQLASLGDCQGDTAYRDSVITLVDFWGDMADGELVTLTGFLADGEISESEVSEAGRITSDLGTRGTAVEESVVRQQAVFAGRFGFGVSGGESEEPDEPAEPEEPEPRVRPTPTPKPKPKPNSYSSSPKVFLRLHGGLDMDYMFAFGRREDNYTAGADVTLAGGLRLGGLYKHDVVGTREGERIHLLLRYGFGSEGRDKVTVGSALFIDPGVAIIDEEEPTFGCDFGGEMTLGIRLSDRFAFGLYYRVAYEAWFDEKSQAAESFSGWEVQPGLYLTVGI